MSSRVNTAAYAFYMSQHLGTTTQRLGSARRMKEKFAAGQEHSQSTLRNIHSDAVFTHDSGLRSFAHRPKGVHSKFRLVLRDHTADEKRAVHALQTSSTVHALQDSRSCGCHGAHPCISATSSAWIDSCRSAVETMAHEHRPSTGWKHSLPAGVHGSMTSAHHTQASGPCKPAVAAASGRCIDGNTRVLVHTH